MMQRVGSPTLKRGPTIDDDTAVLDWANLPQGAQAEYLDASLHDACIVSIRSDLLKRSVSIHCDVEHLREFHHLPEGFQIILGLEGVQSARVFRYSIWPVSFPFRRVYPAKRNLDSSWNIRPSGERSPFHGRTLRRRLLAIASRSSISQTLRSQHQKIRLR